MKVNRRLWRCGFNLKVEPWLNQRYASNFTSIYGDDGGYPKTEAQRQHGGELCGEYRRHSALYIVVRLSLVRTLLQTF